jgi:hypothetical protein
MKRTAAKLCILGFGMIIGVPAQAAPIDTNTALPVAKGEYVVREQGVLNNSGDDPSGANRDSTVVLSATVLGYGVTSELAIFGVLPLVNKKLELTTPVGTRVTREAGGLGDMRFFGRYTIFKQDMQGQTFRIAPFAGVETPTGANSRRDALGKLPVTIQPGSGSWDPFGGLIVTYQTLQYEIDLQGSYQANTEADGFEFGDVARLDASLQYRLWPGELTETTAAFLYGVTELNLIHSEKNRAKGIINPNSGGTTLWGLAGLQYVTPRNIIEAGIQVPLVQDLNGTALEREVIVRGGFRLNF